MVAERLISLFLFQKLIKFGLVGHKAEILEYLV